MALKKGMIPPSTTQAKKFGVNRVGQPEGFFQPLYDYQTYPSSGTSQLTFFANPIGQNGKTLADTNMEAAGSLPAPKRQLVTSIQVVFFSGSEPGKAASTALAWNDAYAVFKSGWLDFFIGSKSYLIDAPVGKFSNDFRLAGASAVSSGSDAIIDYVTFAGPIYEITPIELVPNQNFSVTLNWPTPVGLPSGQDGRIGVILSGFQYRLSQ